jgi:hypothetical protein
MRRRLSFASASGSAAFTIDSFRFGNLFKISGQRVMKYSFFHHNQIMTLYELVLIAKAGKTIAESASFLTLHKSLMKSCALAVLDNKGVVRSFENLGKRYSFLTQDASL